ncbi:MAG: aldose 1-epimerase family protein [Proteobacteria bacterium]|nr:aldose 1-epimerase family protein [Pseudomonadota bacterium]
MKYSLSLALLSIVLGAPRLQAKALLQKTVIDSAHQVDDLSFEVSQATVGRYDSGKNFSIKRQQLKGGLQDGTTLLTVDNGALKIVLIPSRGMGILDVVAEGHVRFGWDSPIKEVVHPKFINLHDRGGLGWLEGFNEFLVRCGVEYAGSPGVDKFINNRGKEDSSVLTLHGRIANIPASKVEVVVEDGTPATIRVRGEVRELTFLGPKLILTTELVTQVGSSSFEVHDTITNVGSGDQEYQLVYHTNFGKPLLEAGSQFVAPVKSLQPREPMQPDALQRYTTYQGPTPRFVEEVFFMTPYANAEGVTKVGLTNRDKSLGASLSFPLKHLPYLSLWKNTASVEDGYVTGIEPGTSYPNNRSVERAAGRVPVLKAGESVVLSIKFSFHTTPESVATMIRDVEAIKDGRATEMK